MNSLYRSVVAASLIALIGCSGDGAPTNTPDGTSSMTKAQVKGKVTVEGKPLTDGEINFNAANVNRRTVGMVTEKIKPDGTFEVSTLVGNNVISLSGPTVSKTPKLQYFSKSYDVKEGSNDLDIAVP
jgi:ABC-type phosphate transport system ATPase subunit